MSQPLERKTTASPFRVPRQQTRAKQLESARKVYESTQSRNLSALVDSTAIEGMKKAIILIDSSIPSLSSTVDTYGISAKRNQEVATKVKQHSVEAVMLPKIHSSVVQEHKFQQNKPISDKATDQLSLRDMLHKKPQLPSIQNRFASTGRHVSGFGFLRGQIFPNQKLSIEVDTPKGDKLNVKGQKSPQHKFEQKFRLKPIMSSLDSSQSPRGPAHLTMRDTTTSNIRKDAQRSFYQTTAKFTNISQNTDLTQEFSLLMGQPPKNKSVLRDVEPIKESMTQRNSVKSSRRSLKPVSPSPFKPKKDKVQKELKPPAPPKQPLILTQEKEGQFQLRIKHIQNSEKRQENDIERLQRKIERINEERQIERKKFRKTIEVLKYENKRVRVPLENFKKLVTQKQAHLEKQSQEIYQKEKVIEQQEEHLKELNTRYTLEKRRLVELERRLDVKERVHKYYQKQMDRLGIDQKFAILEADRLAEEEQIRKELEAAQKEAEENGETGEEGEEGEEEQKQGEEQEEGQEVKQQ